MSIQKVISYAVSQLGTQEKANNDNPYAAIAGHANHQPWCNTFTSACLKMGEEAASCVNTAAVLTTQDWGIKHNRTIPVTEAKRGDLIILNFDKGPRGQHIEIAIHDFDPVKKSIQTIGGNTGDKSQSNGDGVYKKVRSADFICAVVRPNYSDYKKA